MGQWWKNIDKQPHSVPIGNGNVVAARPDDVFEVESETPTLLRLRRQNKVVRSGRPINPSQVAKPEPVRVEVPLKRANTEFAQRTMERGSVKGKDEAKRIMAQAAAARVPEAEIELARRAAEKTAEQKIEKTTETLPVVEVPVAEAEAETETDETKMNDGTAEKGTLSKKQLRRLSRATE